MSDPPLSDIYIKNRMAWVWTTLNLIDFRAKIYQHYIVYNVDSIYQFHNPEKLFVNFIDPPIVHTQVNESLILISLIWTLDWVQNRKWIRQIYLIYYLFSFSLLWNHWYEINKISVKLVIINLWILSFCSKIEK